MGRPGQSLQQKLVFNHGAWGWVLVYSYCVCTRGELHSALVVKVVCGAFWHLGGVDISTIGKERQLELARYSRRVDSHINT